MEGILCHDSVEDYEMEENVDKAVDLGIKDVLSFAWRALKESRLVVLDPDFSSGLFSD